MRCAPYAESLPYDSDDASLIRVARRDFEKAIKVPADFVARCERARLGLLRCLDAGAAGQRLRHHAAVSREDARLSREYRRLLRALRAHRRSADRRRRRGHDDGRRSARCSPSCARELVPIVRAIAEQPLADDSCLRGDFPEAAQLAFGLDVDRALRLRLRARPAGQDASSLLHQVLARRCAHHHARARERHRRGAVLDPARGRPRAVRAGRRRRARGHAARLAAPRPACTRASRGCGRTWSAAAAASGSTSIRSCSDAFPDQFGGVPLETFYRAINKVAALADPHRRRRGDLQPARHAALRSGARSAGRPAAR